MHRSSQKRFTTKECQELLFWVWKNIFTNSCRILIFLHDECDWNL